MRKSIDIYDKQTIEKLSAMQNELNVSTAQLIRISLDALIEKQVVDDLVGYKQTLRSQLADIYITHVIDRQKK